MSKFSVEIYLRSIIQVLPGLYVGSVRDSKDQEQLRSNNITHIISIHDNPKRGVSEDVEYLCILASDKPHQNLVQYFPQCNDFIHAARISGGTVLIHCLAGVSRSVTIAVAYVMSVTSLNWKDGLKCVRAARAIANPNLGFQRQLQDFDGRRLREERRRLGIKFPRTMFRPEDEQEVRQMVTLFDSVQNLPQVTGQPDDRSVIQDGRRRISGSSEPSTSHSSPTLGSSLRRAAKSPFDDLAPGRSPMVRRRTLPTPSTTSVRGAKTI
ncbi:Dual specificity protein phosphatase 22 [Halotydeus destructor]|nr:Dual specificity protein phosphatase 22 [Halotydeus destructor]